MAKRAKKATRHTPPKRRRVYILPYVIMAALIIGIPLGIYEMYQSNVDRNIKRLEEALCDYDVDYLKANTDRLPIILDVLKKSYSEDTTKQDDFYKNNFSNLEINVIESTKSSRGKEVRVEVANVNYVDVFDKIPDDESDDKTHTDYMAALSDPNQERNIYEADLYLERKFSGYRIYESRDFINAILGGALDYADELDAPTTNN